MFLLKLFATAQHTLQILNIVISLQPQKGISYA